MQTVPMLPIIQLASGMVVPNAASATYPSIFCRIIFEVSLWLKQRRYN
jgi:hypothetical protein